MTFHSILFDRETAPKEAAQPEYFADLNLDQVINAVAARGEEYDLKPFFHTPLRDAEIIYYRQEVMRDMENAGLMAQVKTFAEKIVIAACSSLPSRSVPISARGCSRITNAKRMRP